MKNNEAQDKKSLSGVAATLEEFGLVDKKAKHHLERISYKVSTANDNVEEENEIKLEEKRAKDLTSEQDVVVLPGEVERQFNPGRQSVVELASTVWQSMVEFFGDRPYQPSPELVAFLTSQHLAVNDFENTPMFELENLLNQGWYGKLLNAYVSNHLLFKIIAWWILDENGIKHVKDAPNITLVDKFQGKLPEIELTERSVSDEKAIKVKLAPEVIDAKPDMLENNSKCKCCNPLSNYCRTRIWPKNKILLIESDKMLTKIYTVETGLHTFKSFNKIWAALIFTLLMNDIYYFYKHPEKRYGNTLAKILFLRSEHSKMLSQSLTSITVWPELVGIPLVLVLIAIWRQTKHPTRSIPIKEITAIRRHWASYQPDSWQEIGYPLLRFIVPRFINKIFAFSSFPNSQYDFDNAIKTVLWDGCVPATNRIQLFNAIRVLLNRSTKLLHLELLTLMEHFAEHVHPEDVRRLYQYGYDSEIIKSLLYVQGNALAELKKHAGWKNGWMAAFYAHFLLWNIGQPQSKALEPFFWMLQAYRWYATIYFLITLGTGIKDSIDFYLMKKACKDEGKLWIYIDQIKNYACTVCGDLEIDYRKMFTQEDCLYAWFLAQKRTIQELINFFENRAQAMNFDDVTVLNLERQYLNGADLRQFLSVLQKHAPCLQELDLNMTRPNIWSCYQHVSCASLNKLGLQAIANFIQIVPVRMLDLRGQFIQGSDIDVLGSVLNKTQLQTLRLDFYYFGTTAPLHGPFYNPLGDIGASFLAQGLTGSTLQVLNLDYTGISDAGVQALAQSLNASNLQELYLANNQINELGGIALGQALSNSSLTLLDLGCWSSWYDVNFQAWCSITLPCANSIGSEGARAIAASLSASKLQNLDLNSNNLGTVGVEYLATALPVSELQYLFLSNNNLISTGIAYLAAALPASKLQSLVLYANNLDSTCAEYLAAVLSNSSLRVLGLGSNNLGPAGVEYLAAALPTSKLQSLVLFSNNLGPIGAEYLSAALPVSNLQILNLNSNNLGPVGAEHLAAVLPASKLQVLRLTYNNFGSTGAEYLAAALSNSSLQELYLDFNNLESAGAQYLSTALPESSLKILHLSFNNFESDSAGYLAATLPVSEIQELSLLSNNIGPAGAEYLSEALPASNLQILNLNDNNLGSAGAEYLAEALPVSKLQALLLSFNDLGSIGAEYLAATLPASKLQLLVLSHNNIQDTGALALANALTPSYFDREQVSTQLWVESLDPNSQRAAGWAQPTTNLKYLGLVNNNLTHEGAKVICNILHYTDIPFNGLDLSGNSVNEDVMGMCGVYSSAASRLELPLPLRLIEQLFKSIKEIIWTTETYRSQFRYEDIILIQAINGENVENKKSHELLMTSLSINTMPKPLSALPMPNYQKPSVILSPVLYQTQNNNSVSSLLLLVILGMMLFWTFKKIIRFDNHREIKHYKKTDLAEIYQTEQNISRTRKKTSINSNNFWVQSREKQKAQEEQKLEEKQAGPSELQVTGQTLMMGKCHC